MFTRDANAGIWTRWDGPTANYFDFTVGNGFVCAIAYEQWELVNPATGDQYVGPFRDGGWTTCMSGSGPLSDPNVNFQNANGGSSFPYGYAEAIAMGPLNPNNNSPTYFVASSDGLVWYFDGVNWDQAAQWSTFLSPVGPSVGGPTGTSVNAVWRLAYEFTNSAGQAYDWCGWAPGGQSTYALNNCLFLLGDNGHVYQKEYNSTEFSDTGITNVIQLSYSPASPGMSALVNNGQEYVWNDAQGASWDFTGQTYTNYFNISVGGASGSVGGMVQALSYPTGYTVDFAWYGQTLQWTESALDAMDIDLAWADQGVNETPPVLGIISIQEGAVGATLRGFPATGGPVADPLENPGTDVLWVLDEAEQLWSYEMQTFWGDPPGNYGYTGAPVGDWAFGSYKGQCAEGTALTGISEDPAEGHMHLIQCTPSTVAVWPFDEASCYGRLFPSGGGDNRGYTDNGVDWDYGYYKLECNNNEYVAGVAQNPGTGQLTGILCCQGGGPDRSNCNPQFNGSCIDGTCGWGGGVLNECPLYSEIFYGGNTTNTTTDWDIGYDKGICGNYATWTGYILGISAVASSTEGVVGAPHSILCGFYPYAN